MSPVRIRLPPPIHDTEREKLASPLCFIILRLPKNPQYTDDANVHFALREALARGVNFSVLLQIDPEGGTDNRALAILKSHNVVVKKTNDDTVQKNFVVVDGRAYRLEEDVKARSGCACANDPTEAEKLKSEFEAVRLGETEPGSPRKCCADVVF